MGWIGVGVFVATAIIFLHRYPRRVSESVSPTPSPRPDSRSDALPIPPADKPLPARHYGSPTTSDLIEPEEDAAQTTPKAPVSCAPPSVSTVPVLTLDSEPGDHNPGRAVIGSVADQIRNETIQQPVIAGCNDRDLVVDIQAPSALPSSLPRLQHQPLTPPASNASTSFMMPPPPVPRLRPTAQPTGQLQPPRLNASSSLRPPPSAAAGLRVPPGSGGSRLSSSTLAPTPVTLKKSSASKKVILEPGYSPLDWAALAANPNSQLRGVGLPPGLLRIPPSMLKLQNGRKGRDAWTSYQGKVYNITPYLPYHPGGKGELLRGAGKDSAKLFQEIHPWVNWDGILSECLVGILVSENDVQAENSLDAMD